MSEFGRDRVLVVDDDPGMRRTIERILGPLYDLEMASSAEEAVQAAGQSTFDVALVDIQLGDGDGYSLCRVLKRSSPETDVILITGSHSTPDEKLFRSLEEDAFYFLFKPFERRVLRALVERCLRLQHERRAKESYASMLADDLDRARQFQQGLMPRGPLCEGGWFLDGVVQPCDALGGDFFLSLSDRGGNLLFAVGDVVGHGVGAAMYAGMLWSTLDAARRRDPEPKALLDELVRGIDFFELGRFATLFYGLLRPDGRLRYFNAGHPPALWLRGDDEVRRLEATGLFLTTMVPGGWREVREVELRPGERLLVYTDGVFEALDPAEGELGLDGLQSVFVESRKLDREQVVPRTLERVRDHCAGRPLADDATLLLVERTGTSD